MATEDAEHAEKTPKRRGVFRRLPVSSVAISRGEPRSPDARRTQTAKTPIERAFGSGMKPY